MKPGPLSLLSMKATKWKSTSTNSTSQSLSESSSTRKPRIDLPIAGPLTVKSDDLVQILLASPARRGSQRQILEIVVLRDGRKLTP